MFSSGSRAIWAPYTRIFEQQVEAINFSLYLRYTRYAQRVR